MKTLKYKFKPGRRVYWCQLKSGTIETPCMECDGEGYLESPLFRRQIECKKCNGSGKDTSSGKLTFVTNSGIIDYIHISIYPLYTNIRYIIDDDGKNYEIVEDELFDTREEAEIDCNKRNNTKMGYSL